MYAIVYRVRPTHGLRMWSKIFREKDAAETERGKLCKDNPWQAWIIFFDDPRTP